MQQSPTTAISPQPFGAPRTRPRVAVVQDGARLHYAVPLALQQAGLLRVMYTQWYNAPASIERLAARLARWRSPAAARRMAERYCPDLDAKRVAHRPWLVLRELRARRRGLTGADFFIWQARQVSRWITGRRFDGANALCGFVSNIDPDLCDRARQAGLRVVVDQIIAPVPVLMAEADRQRELFPDWQAEDDAAGQEPFIDVERRTWAAADHVTCASAYVAQGLAQQGVPRERTSMLPYPIDTGPLPIVDRAGRSGPVVVGLVGAVNLRKGAPWFFRVARSFDPKLVRFVMVGKVQLHERIARQHAGAVELVGPVPRGEVAGWLSRFDVFLFPSTCEGSATVLMEAMATGLPVITTPNSGTVARDGVEGFVAAYDDVATLTRRVEQLVRDPRLRLEMGHAARRRVEQFGLGWYSRELAALYDRVLNAGA